MQMGYMKKSFLQPAMTVHVCNLSTQKAEAEPSGTESHDEFEASLGYIVSYRTAWVTLSHKLINNR